MSTGEDASRGRWTLIEEPRSDDEGRAVCPNCGRTIIYEGTFTLHRELVSGPHDCVASGSTVEHAQDMVDRGYWPHLCHKLHP